MSAREKLAALIDSMTEQEAAFVLAYLVELMEREAAQ